MKKERIDKFIASQTGFSRSEVKALLKKGSVLVNDAPCRSADAKIDPEADAVSVGGQAVRFRKHVCIMLNKPTGVVSATEDKNERTVLDLLPDRMKRPGLFPAGRLDKDTTGLLLITDDGDLSHRMLSPKKHVKKTYRATLDRAPDEGVLEGLSHPITLRDGAVCRPAEEVSADGVEVTLSIREGKYHQVKRMFAALGCRVVALERLSIGALTLDPALKRGEARELSEQEIKRIFEDEA